MRLESNTSYSINIYTLHQHCGGTGYYDFCSDVATPIRRRVICLVCLIDRLSITSRIYLYLTFRLPMYSCCTEILNWVLLWTREDSCWKWSRFSYVSFYKNIKVLRLQSLFKNIKWLFLCPVPKSYTVTHFVSVVRYFVISRINLDKNKIYYSDRLKFTYWLDFLVRIHTFWIQITTGEN